MRLSVRRRHVCPGEERRILRKSAFCTGDVTGKRILQIGPHGKAHFGCNHLDPQGGVRMQRRDTRTRSRVLSEGDVLRSVIVNAKLFNDIIKKLSNEIITVELEDKSRVSIKTTNSRFNIVSQSVIK